MSRQGNRIHQKPYQNFSALGQSSDEIEEWGPAEHIGLHLHGAGKNIDEAISHIGKLIRHATIDQPLDEFIELRETLNRASMQTAKILVILAKEKDEP